MKPPLAGATAAGIACIAVACGAVPAFATGTPEAAPSLASAQEAGTDPLEGYGGYGVYSYAPADGGTERPEQWPAEPEKGPAEEAEASATIGVPQEPRGTATDRDGDTATGVPERDSGTDPDTAETLPATGDPLAVLVWLGAAMLAAGATLLWVANLLRYQPRHRITR